MGIRFASHNLVREYCHDHYMILDVVIFSLFFLFKNISNTHRLACNYFFGSLPWQVQGIFSNFVYLIGKSLPGYRRVADWDSSISFGSSENKRIPRPDTFRNLLGYTQCFWQRAEIN